MATTTIPSGIYTIVGNTSHRTIRIEDAPAHFNSNSRIISYLRGKDNTSDYTGYAFLTERNEVRVWKRFADANDIIAAANFLVRKGVSYAHEAGKAYARMSGNCYICDRVLTTPQSLEAGIGPICIKKVQ